MQLKYKNNAYEDSFKCSIFTHLDTYADVRNMK